MKHKYSTIIIDDEPLSISVIEEYISAFSEIEVVGKFTKSRAALDAILTLKPDFILLDIQMPVLNGFELIEKILPHHQPFIIFTTAFDQYAIQAFEMNAIAYLLKPIQKDKFNIAVSKAISQLELKNKDFLYEALLLALKAKPQKNDYLNKIMIKEVNRIFYLDVEDIIYFETFGDYLKVFTKEKFYIIHETLVSVEKNLNPDHFIRIHRSHLIQVNQIKEFQPHFNGEYNVVMKNGAVLKLSRNYKENLSRLFSGL